MPESISAMTSTESSASEGNPGAPEAVDQQVPRHNGEQEPLPL